MAGERKAIRDGFKATLQSVFTGEIFTSRRFDLREEDDDCLNIFLDEGEINYEDLQPSTEARLTIGFHTKSLDSDDDLDAVGDVLYAAIEENASNIAADLITGIVPAGFEYGNEQEQELTSLFLYFTVIY